MIKLIELNIGENVCFEDNYENFLCVKRDDMGYHIFDDSQSYGPYEIVVADVKIKEVCVCGISGKDAEYYMAGVNGLAYLEAEEESSLKKEFNKIMVEKELKLLPGCRFVGEVDVYKMEYNPDHWLAQKDGNIHVWLEDEKRHVFCDSESKYFVVNPKKDIKPLDNYKKFDTYEEICMAVNEKGYDYGLLPKSDNRHLAVLFTILKRSRGCSNKLIRKIFEVLKQELGMKEFLNLKYELKYKTTKHNLVDLEELYKKLSSADLSRLEKYFKEHWNFTRYDYPFPYACALEIEDALKSVESSYKYSLMKIAYGDKLIEIPLTFDRAILDRIGNDKLYDWTGMANFCKDKPKWFWDISDLENNKLLYVERACKRKQTVRYIDPMLPGNLGETENE